MTDISLLTNPRFVNLTGKKFTRWTVIDYAGKDKCKRSTWLCKCDCGVVKTIEVSGLTSKHTQSCGCLRKELSIKRLTTHKMIKTPEYKAWVNMKSRCNNPNLKHYKNYGGRGITVCERWLNSFENFFDDMGLRTTPKHSIDRIDNNGDYSPNNCKWSTPIEQRSNRRDKTI